MNDLTRLRKLIQESDEGPKPCRTCVWYSNFSCINPAVNGWENLCDNCNYHKLDNYG